MLPEERTVSTKTRTCTGCGADLTLPKATKRTPAGRRWNKRIGWHDGTATYCTNCHTWTTWDTVPDCAIQVRQYSRAHGSHFFDDGTMRFFGSKLADDFEFIDGRAYFITSEKQPTDYVTGHYYPRRYTLRYMTAGANFFEPEPYGFGSFDTLRHARAALRKIASK
jgi:hypothetical protein